MLKTIFLLKSGRVNRDRECYIILRLIYKNKKITIASGKFISKERKKDPDKPSGKLSEGGKREGY